MSTTSQIEVTQLGYQAERNRIAGMLDGPVLHIGSRSQIIDQKIDGRFTWRDALAGKQLVGVDLEPGDNVDDVVDITWDQDRIDDALDGRRFGSILCSHLLEHVTNPFDAARNISDLLEPGGIAFIQVPWVQAPALGHPL